MVDDASDDATQSVRLCCLERLACSPPSTASLTKKSLPTLNLLPTGLGKSKFATSPQLSHVVGTRPYSAFLHSLGHTCPKVTCSWLL